MSYHNPYQNSYKVLYMLLCDNISNIIYNIWFQRLHHGCSRYGPTIVSCRTSRYSLRFHRNKILHPTRWYLLSWPTSVCTGPNGKLRSCTRPFDTTRSQPYRRYRGLCMKKTKLLKIKNHYRYFWLILREFQTKWRC